MVRGGQTRRPLETKKRREGSALAGRNGERREWTGRAEKRRAEGVGVSVSRRRSARAGAHACTTRRPYRNGDHAWDLIRRGAAADFAAEGKDVRSRCPGPVNPEVQGERRDPTAVIFRADLLGRRCDRSQASCQARRRRAAAVAGRDQARCLLTAPETAIRARRAVPAARAASRGAGDGDDRIRISGGLRLGRPSAISSAVVGCCARSQRASGPRRLVPDSGGSPSRYRQLWLWCASPKKRQLLPLTRPNGMPRPHLHRPMALPPTTRPSP